MSRYKKKSRKLARQHFWEKHDRESYACPDCGREEEDVAYSFEVHHKNGEPMDNRPENHVALCRTCHNLREGKKPSLDQIQRLRNHIKKESAESNENDGTPEVYLAGSMDYDSSEHQGWRSSVAERADRGTYRYTGSTPIGINSPTEVEFSHGCGPVHGIAGDDMELVDESDAILAYFEKEEQVGTLTELVYAVTQGKPALVIFDASLVPLVGKSNCPWDSISAGVEYHHVSPVYWFLINFLAGDGWDGLDGDVTLRVVESRDEIKSCFQDWEWHKQGYKQTLRKFDSENAGVADR